MEQTWGIFEDAMQLSCLAIADRHERKVRIIGSATYILPGIFATARHMIEEYLKTHMGIIGPVEEIFKGAVPFEIDLLHVRKEGTIVWKISEVHLWTDADIVLLVAAKYVTIPENAPALQFDDFPYLTINLHPPRPGSKIMSLGFPNTKNVVLDEMRSEHRLELHSKIGHARAMHHKAPMTGQFALETDTPLVRGMSGGPTFNENGELFAINSASFDPGTDHDAYTSFHAMLTHVMGIPFEAPLAAGPTVTTLLALAQDGFIPVKGIKHLELTGTGYKWHDDRTCADCGH